MKNKKLIYFILIVSIATLLLVGCSNGETIVGIRMAEPQSSSDDKFAFEDEDISITFMPYADDEGLKGIAFELKNKTDNVLKVKWNEASFVNPQGVASRVMHSGVKYSDRDKELSDSTIPVGAKIQDHVVPTENVFYGENQGWLSSGSSWQINPIIKSENIQKQNVSLLLPIEKEEETKNYQFKFEVYTAK